MIECGALWLDDEGAPCMLEKGHEQKGEYEHWTRVRLEYPDGNTGGMEIIWRAGEEIDFVKETK